MFLTGSVVETTEDFVACGPGVRAQSFFVPEHTQAVVLSHNDKTGIFTILTQKFGEIGVSGKQLRYKALPPMRASAPPNTKDDRMAHEPNPAPIEDDASHLRTENDRLLNRITEMQRRIGYMTDLVITRQLADVVAKEREAAR